MNNPAEPDLTFDTVKTQFVTTMSHEIRTPLSVILLSVRLLKGHGHQCSEEKRLEYLHRIEVAARQMDRLFNEQLVSLGADPSPHALTEIHSPLESRKIS